MLKFINLIQQSSQIKKIKSVWHAPYGRILCVIFLSALALRFWGIRFGLPYRYHIDETFYVALSLQMAANRFDLPIITHGPNLFFMVLLGEYAIYAGYLFLSGNIDSITAFEQVYRTDPTPFVLLARVTSVFAGVLTLIPLWGIGRKIGNTTISLLSVLFLAFSFQHIRESHYGTPDVFVGLLVTCCLLTCLYILEQGQLKNYLLCGVFAGLATGTKFTNFLLFVPIGLAHLFVTLNGTSSGFVSTLRRFFGKNLFSLAIVSFLAFAFAYPNLFLKPYRFIEYVQFLAGVGQVGFESQFLVDSAPAWLYYLNSLVSWGIGPVLFALAMGGIGIGLLRHRQSDIILLSFLFAYYLFLGRAPYYASRYVVPLLPILSFYAAVAVCWLVTTIQSKSTTTVISKYSYPILAILALSQPVAFSLRHNYLLTQTDTRTIAKEWIEMHIPPNTKIAVDWRKHTPPIRPIIEPYPSNDLPYDIVEVGGIGLPKYSLDEYRTDGVRYLIMSSFIDGLQLASSADIQTKEYFKFSLQEETDLVFSITPYKENPKLPFLFDQMFGPVIHLWQLERPGPEIHIYRLN